MLMQPSKNNAINHKEKKNYCNYRPCETTWCCLCKKEHWHEWVLKFLSNFSFFTRQQLSFTHFFHTKKKCKMNSISVNLYRYYSNYVFLHNFAWPNVNEFWALLAKIWFFFYYIDANVLTIQANIVNFF